MRKVHSSLDYIFFQLLQHLSFSSIIEYTSPYKATKTIALALMGYPNLLGKLLDLIVDARDE